MSLMSTREGVYGESDNTFVPSDNLRDGLRAAPMQLLTTLQDPKTDDHILAYVVSAATTGSTRASAASRTRPARSDSARRGECRRVG